MNERIKELAEQAENYAHEQNDKFGLSYKREYDKKFAELIVKECVGIALEQKKQVEDQEVFNPQDEQWNRARIQQSQKIVDKIEQHFGVEE